MIVGQCWNPDDGAFKPVVWIDLEPIALDLGDFTAGIPLGITLNQVTGMNILVGEATDGGVPLGDLQAVYWDLNDTSGPGGTTPMVVLPNAPGMDACSATKVASVTDQNGDIWITGYCQPEATSAGGDRIGMLWTVDETFVLDEVAAADGFEIETGVDINANGAIVAIARTDEGYHSVLLYPEF